MVDFGISSSVTKVPVAMLKSQEVFPIDDANDDV
jgi:hypothetical protein